MSLRVDCIKRNYELEGLKYKLKGKRILAMDDPLAQMKANEDSAPSPFGDDAEEVDAEENDDMAAATITHKLGQQDPLADFHKLEVMMLNRHEFEAWESKKLKIFARFKNQTDDAEIIIDE